MNTLNNISVPTGSIFSIEEVRSFRNETSGCRNVVHLNNAGAGLMPDVVTKAQLDHITLESEIGGYEASAFKAQAVQEFYSQAASLFNCKPSNIAFTASATDSYTRALSSIPFKPGDVILTDQDDFCFKSDSVLVSSKAARCKDHSHKQCLGRWRRCERS
jgi:selenocysteine lyase/cysteine desulfurase